MSQGNSQQNLSEQLTTYFKGVKNEWGKVSWPTKQQVVADTIIVLLVVTFFTIVIFLMDKIFGWGLETIKHLFGSN